MNLYSPDVQPKRVCLVHDWLTGMRGGEHVLEAIAEQFPEAPIYTLFARPERLSPTLKRRPIHTSWLQKIPGVLHFYRWLLPLFPGVIRQFDLNQFDLIISTSHCVAKSVKVNRDAVHVCYCHSPMRYAWDMTEAYFGHWPKPARWVLNQYFEKLRRWDRETAQRVDFFISNSDHIRNKIMRFYSKESTTIHPPVQLGEAPRPAQKSEDYFLMVGALVPYKRFDLAIDAFNTVERPLKIVGDGPARKKLEHMVRHSGIKFEGWLDETDLKKRYQSARALIFPGEEDFGIVPLEAQKFGKPVIAYGRGGVCETVIPHDTSKGNNARTATGLFFGRQDVEALVRAILKFEALEFDPQFISAHTDQFSRGRFVREFNQFLMDRELLGTPVLQPH